MSYDKLVDSAQLDASLTSIANKIRAQNCTKAQLNFPNDFISEIRADLCEPKDVDFIDYDGQLVYSYTAQEFLALTELPANPTNKGLVAQGWNWTLADAKEIVAEYGFLVIGQNYTTSDGRTRYYLEIPSQPAGYQYKANLTLIATAKNGVRIYWGDGTESIWTGNANVAASMEHYYTSGGKYVIELEVLSGQITTIGGRSSNSRILGNNRIMQYVKKVEIGDNVVGIGYCPFRGANQLQSISIPITVTSLDDYNETAFESRVLTGLVFPKNLTTNRYRWMFPNQMCIKYISIPKGMHNFALGSGAVPQCLRKLLIPSLEPYSGVNLTVQLSDCPTLTHYYIGGTYTSILTDSMRSSAVKKLWIPASVTSIAATAFIYNWHLAEVHLRPTSPPTLANANAFGSSPTTCVFYVPYSVDHSILSAYQTATNWSTYADRMQEEPQS